ncbi:MAG: hypothetical protein HPY64_12700 [Anaerolineae bacterium]|nr:hypothetical protein [Anaerolineae bacterium]
MISLAVFPGLGGILNDIRRFAGRFQNVRVQISSQRFSRAIRGNAAWWWGECPRQVSGCWWTGFRGSRLPLRGFFFRGGGIFACFLRIINDHVSGFGSRFVAIVVGAVVAGTGRLPGGASSTKVLWWLLAERHTVFLVAFHAVCHGHQFRCGGQVANMPPAITGAHPSALRQL